MTDLLGQARGAAAAENPLRANLHCSFPDRHLCQRMAVGIPRPFQRRSRHGSTADARGHFLWNGLNVELSKRTVTIIRRFGTTPFSLATYPDPPTDSFSFRTETDGSIQVIIEHADACFLSRQSGRHKDNDLYQGRRSRAGDSLSLRATCFVLRRWRRPAQVHAAQPEWNDVELVVSSTDCAANSRHYAFGRCGRSLDRKHVLFHDGATRGLERQYRVSDVSLTLAEQIRRQR